MPLPCHSLIGTSPTLVGFEAHALVKKHSTYGHFGSAGGGEDRNSTNCKLERLENRRTSRCDGTRL